MVLELRDTGKLNADNARKGRFSDFMAQLYLLTGLLASETQKLTRSSLILARSFNANVANFFSDILGIIVIDFPPSQISLMDKYILATEEKFSV